MSEAYEAVKEFHKKFGHPIDIPFDHDHMMFREKLIAEETREYIVETALSAMQNQFTDNMVKEMADMLYVIYGKAVAFGIDIDEAFRRVHESNMSKLGADGLPIRREDGKILKGPNYFEPDMTGLIKNV